MAFYCRICAYLGDDDCYCHRQVCSECGQYLDVDEEPDEQERARALDLLRGLYQRQPNPETGDLGLLTSWERSADASRKRSWR